MTEAPTEVDRVAALEGEIRNLRGFDRKILAFVSIVTLAGAAWGFFGLRGPVTTVNEEIATLGTKQSGLASSLETLEAEIEGRRAQLVDLERKAISAQEAADRAIVRAGTLELAVGEAKQAARQSLDASKRAEDANNRSLEMIQDIRTTAKGARDASEQSSRASQAANEAAQAASASLENVRELATYAKSLVDDLDRSLKGYDRKIAVLSATFNQIRAMLKTASRPAPRGPSTTPESESTRPAPVRPTVQRKILINITGTGSVIILNPGAALLDDYSASATGYEGEFLIPDKAIVELTIDATGVQVIAHRSLRGRIIEKRTKRSTGSTLTYR